MTKAPTEIYCPVCGRTIEAANIPEVERGELDLYWFLHDDIEHDNDDLQAIEHGIQ